MASKQILAHQASRATPFALAGTRTILPAVSSYRSVSSQVTLVAQKHTVDGSFPEFRRSSKYNSDQRKQHESRPKNFYNLVRQDPTITRLFDKSQEEWNLFQSRHIGPRGNDVDEMLKLLGPGAETLDGFVSQVIPEDVMLPPSQPIQPTTHSEYIATRIFDHLMKQNRPKIWMNGSGFYPTTVPPVIKRNILENPGWYTSYTPYQPEISQGRLESLLNYQTMVSDLTGLPISNASLLDEGTAAAEAMTMSLNSLSTSRAKRPGKTFVVSDKVHEHSWEVIQGRAEGFGINLVQLDLSASDALEKVEAYGDDLVGVLVQYPDTKGGVQDFRNLAEVVHKQGALLTAATDLLSLTLLTPPGEWGADIAIGNSQRFGVPLGYGGPHAAFMAVKESSKRRMAGRLIGVSKDRLGRRALRLALQTREQHIRREKATSNVCTAQALLANMAAMFAIYHGPEQLKSMAIQTVRFARALQMVAEHYGHQVVTATPDPEGKVLSDTVTIRFQSPDTLQNFRNTMYELGVSIGINGHLEAVLAASVSTGPAVFSRIAEALQKFAILNRHEDSVGVSSRLWNEVTREGFSSKDIPEVVRRESSFLTHPVFNSHHSETELLRYIHHLQSKDLSLVHSMIPLGSCTMKLNGTSQMELITNENNANIHPRAGLGSQQGFSKLFAWLSKQLTVLTGMEDCSLQPNSGAQGEFAGLRTIRKYHESNGSAKRDICLIPVSAHGTNPASAAMAGMRVVPIKCDTKTGNLDIADLEEKCKKHADELGAIMITYPSTYGVFEPDVRKACDLVHQYGGQVYMDGANMNAQIGLTSPGAIGADVCHLNLHKTFCIPHGGGGPGVGPICVKQHLGPFLPHKPGQTKVASSAYGSASILPISWMYMATMGKYRALDIHRKSTVLTDTP